MVDRTTRRRPGRYVVTVVVSVNKADIDFLRTRIDRNAQFHCKDGEVIVGLVHFVSEEEQDVIYDLITSNRMVRYQSFENSTYRLTFEEIEFVTLPES